MQPDKRIWRALIVALFVSIALAVPPARAVEVERVVSPGGIEAWLVADRSNPILSVKFAFRSGTSGDPEGKAGLAKMVSGLLTEGAGEYESETFQDLLADNSITLSFDVERDSFRGSLRTLTRHRDKAFDLLRLALTEPRFEAGPVERIRKHLQVRAAQSSQDPSTIAWRTLYQAQFAGHPYRRPTDGTAESLAAITVDDLRSFAAEAFGRDSLVIGVSGDIDAASLARLLDSTFGTLPSSGRQETIAEVVPAAGGGVIVIDREQPQSVVALAQPGIKRDDPDFYAAYVVNYILGGGGFTSRLYSEVREKRGLAYSVYAYLRPMDHAALVIGGVATENARVGESLELILANWQRMAEQGPSAEELAAAKLFLTGSFPLRLSSTANIADILVMMQVDSLGIDYLERRNDYIEAVTLDDARRVAAALYDAAAVTAVVVGRPEGIEATRQPPEAG
jgi:zinc protease